MDEDYRVTYYTRGILEPQSILVNKDMYRKYYYDGKTKIKRIYRDAWSHQEEALYCKEIQPFLTKPILIDFYDTHYELPFPCVCKARPVTAKNNVIARVSYDRPFGSIKRNTKEDIPFERKYDYIMWRGCSSGFGKRLPLVKKYFYHKEIDVGFTGVELRDPFPEESRKWIKNIKKPKEMLKYKFLISVEGNDGATDLKWKLYSNSCVLMPHPPKICTWFMEDHLVPWVHYVPLQWNFNDLEQKYQWCLHHQEQCKQISKNATKYVEQFLNEPRERRIMKKVFDRWAKNITLQVK